MNKGVTLGQYLPGDSFIHRLDPRIKILLTIVFMVTIFYVDGFLGYGAMLLGVAAIVVVADIPLKRLIRGLRPILWILIITFIINVLTTPGQPKWTFWIFKISESGLYKALFIAIRIMMLVVGTSVLTLTTSPMALTDGLEALLKPLSVIRFPAHALSMMISIALRFIPTLFDEADKIVRAQKARGADFESGNILSRAKAMIPLMVPLFLNAFHRAEELGTAMEARCYRGGEGRTRLNPLRLKRCDLITLTAATAGLVMIAYLL